MLTPSIPFCHKGSCIRLDNHKNYNVLDCDWFKKLLFSTNSLATVVIGQFIVGQFSHIQSCSLNQPITTIRTTFNNFMQIFPFSHNFRLGYSSFLGNCIFHDLLIIRLRVVSCGL